MPAILALGGMTRFEPGRDAPWRAARRSEWRRAVSAALAWAGT